jgi:endogenous inhibitor of DNA gyrase (YacG/DUF329 family)
MSTRTDKAPGDAAAAPCAICGKPSTRAYRPFCSRRCADIDLSRWLNEAYAVPGEPVGVDDSEDERN